jgi:hypothetical protein
MANVLDRNFDFATNGTVTAAGLHNLIDETNIYAGLISTQEEKTTVGTADLLLVADSSSIGSPQIAANRTTVYNLFEDALTGGTYANAQLSGNLTYGTATGNRTISTSANITNGTITNGTIPNFTAGTTISTIGTITNLSSGTTNSTSVIATSGTIGTLSATGGTFGGALTSTAGTIATFNSTTGTIGNFTTTLTGDLTISTGSATVGTRVAVLNTAQQYSRAHNFAATALTITGGTIPWNLAENQVATLDVTTNSTMNTPTNPQAGCTYVMIVTQGTGGSNTLSFSTAYKFAGGSAPVLSTGSAQVDVVSFVSNGTVLFGVASQNFS